jgi:hypothetical protein
MTPSRPIRKEPQRRFYPVCSFPIDSLSPVSYGDSAPVVTAFHLVGLKVVVHLPHRSPADLALQSSSAGMAKEPKDSATAVIFLFAKLT